MVPLFSASAVFSALVKYIGRPSSDCNEVTLRYVLGELRLGKYLQHNSEAPSPIGVFLDPPAVLAMMQLPRFQARAQQFPARLHRAPWCPAAPRLRGSAADDQRRGSQADPSIARASPCRCPQRS